MNIIQNSVTARFQALLTTLKKNGKTHFSLHDFRSVGVCCGTAKYRIDCVYRLRGIIEFGHGRAGHKQVWRTEDLESAMKGWDE